MDALQWMGAVRMRVQTADKYITIIHTTPVHQLTSGEDKTCMFVRNKSIIKTFLTWFWLKYESIIHNIAFSVGKKVFWSESGEKSAQIKQRLQDKTVQNSSKQICCWIWCERQQEMDLFTGGRVIMDFSRKWQFEIKNIFMMDLFHLLSSPDVNWWTGVVWITCGLLWCFYQMFGLSFWRHPFTAEHPLLRQWCNFSKSDEETNPS